MRENENILRDIYNSDIILNQEEEDMLEKIHIRYFDLIDQFQERMKDQQLTLNQKDIEDLDSCVNEFVYEYGFIQFKRGIHLAVAISQGCY